MAKKSDKTLCDWSRDELADLSRLREIVRDPRWLCRKCGRVAQRKKFLCKATALEPRGS
jgi:hypothetical protein